MNEDVLYVGLVDYPGYVLGTDGSVWSYKVGPQFPQKAGVIGHSRRQLRGALDGRPGREYRKFNLRDKHGVMRNVHVHNLLLRVFVGPPPDGMEACHKNGDKMDNRLENLYWGTREDNMADRKRHRALGMCGV